jgi:uncharacterized protein (TIGR02246 family)
MNFALRRSKYRCRNQSVIRNRTEETTDDDCSGIQPLPHRKKNNLMSIETPADSVRDVIKAVYEAWADNDAAAFAEFYTSDATVVQPGIHKKNKEEILTTMAAAFAGPLKGSRVLDETQSVRLIGSDAAVVITEGGILMPGETDIPSERLVRATWVLTAQDGRWYVAAYQNSPAN